MRKNFGYGVRCRVLQTGAREHTAHGRGKQSAALLFQHASVRHDERLRRVPITDVPVGCHEYIACRKDRHMLRKIQAFFDIAKAVAPILAERKIATPVKS